MKDFKFPDKIMRYAYDPNKPIFHIATVIRIIDALISNYIIQVRQMRNHAEIVRREKERK